MTHCKFLPNHLLNARLRGLYVITDERMGGGHHSIVRAALAGGARIIQLRDKSTPLARLLPIACEVRRLTREAKALLIVNDRVDLALASEADGVHLGPDDLSPARARLILGTHRLIGVSCGDADEACRAQQAGANYIGAGAVFATSTKNDAGAAIGLEGLRAIVAATTLPVAAIGGLSAINIGSTIEAGAAMACVVSAVAAAGDAMAMTAATRDLMRAVDAQA